MSQSALPTNNNAIIQREDDDGQPLKLSDGQSLELEDLHYFDWGENNIGGGGGGSGSGTNPTTPSQQQSAAAEDDDKWGPLPFDGFTSQTPQSSDGGGVFGFGHSYWGGFRSWGGNGGSFDNNASASPVIATPLPMAEDDSDDDLPPGMVRSTSGSLSSDTSDGDETMSNAGSSIVDDGSATSDATSTSSSKGVTFNEQVRVLPIPPISAYSVEQRFRMYANRFELRENKVRNKREYEFDNYDWRNATEEHSMAICPLSGELLHPAHL